MAVIECADCARRSLRDLIAERRSLLQEMRAAGSDVTTREVLRAQVAVLDAEIADLRRSERFIERVIWSPKHGGCLMIQRKYTDAHTSVARALGPGWHDWTSGCEGEYPTNDESARRAVIASNARLATTHSKTVTP